MSAPKGKNSDRVEGRVECRIHGPACLAQIRATDRPDHLLDFLDRQVKMLGSGHWDIKVTLNMLALVGGIAGLLWMLTLPMSKVSQIAGVHPIQALVLGGLGLSGASAAYRFRKRRARRRSSTQQLESNADPAAHE
ncbi:hypothetical protein [Nocardia neocaledoniensis]|uniref:hypothetical protein n=1 Tax=Nocardia neocaledoniensis TaxID=236511 RepID=UPI002458FDD8|nr:hypothetical protein [Nocardia neocaledoniensis]